MAFKYRADNVGSVLNNQSSDDGNYISLGGSDRRCQVSTFNISSSTSDIVVTGLGFQPECLIIFGAVTFLNTGFDGLFLHYGVATSAADQWAMSVNAGDNESFQPRWSAFSSGRIMYQSSGGALDFEMSLQSFDADGFTINVEDAPGATFPVIYAALAGGGSYACGTEDTRTTTGSQTVSPGFVADCVLFGHTGRTADPDISDNMIMGIGAADGDSQNYATISADRGVVFSTTRQDTGFCLTVAETTVAGGSVLTQASLVDLDNGGDFELDYTAADGNAYKYGWLALQQADTGRFVVDIAADLTTPAIPTATDTMGLFGWSTTINDAGAPGSGPGSKDANGWVEGASLGFSATDESLTPEHSCSIQDLSSPPFTVIQTRRDMRPWSFSCFRHVGSGSLIVGTDSRSSHPVDVYEYIVDEFLPQIYRRVIQRR